MENLFALWMSQEAMLCANQLTQDGGNTSSMMVQAEELSTRKDKSLEFKAISITKADNVLERTRMMPSPSLDNIGISSTSMLPDQ